MFKEVTVFGSFQNEGSRNGETHLYRSGLVPYPKNDILSKICKPRDECEKPLGDAGALSDLETQIPDMVGGTLFSHRECLEPFERICRSEGDGMEEVTPARLNP